MTKARLRPIAAAIDIGSNSIKMTVARPGEGGGIDQIDWASEVVRLGQGLDDTGRLDDRRIEAAVATLTQFAARARELGAVQIAAVATEATRTAANGAEFLDRVRREAGLDVQAISGLDEAALMFRGLAATTDVSGPIVVADIGGGSTELIVARDGTVAGTRSLPLGSGRLTERHVHADPPTPEELLACEAAASAIITAAAKSIALPKGGEVRLIIVGGTGEFMVRLLPAGVDIGERDVRSVLGKLAVLTAAELADAIDAPETRARVLPAGVAIVAAIVRHVQPQAIEVAHSGLRSGLLIDAFNSMDLDSAISAEASESAFPGLESIPQIDNAFPANIDFRDVMSTLIANRWAALWTAIPAAISGDDIEGVHDVRVASRRLRAAMDVAVPLYPHKWFRQLHRLAKEITSALGEVRDRDVLLESLEAELAGVPLAERPGIERLIARIEQERAAARTEMEQFLDTLLKSDAPNTVERRFGVPAASFADETPRGAQQA